VKPSAVLSLGVAVAFSAGDEAPGVVVAEPVAAETVVAVVVALEVGLVSGGALDEGDVGAFVDGAAFGLTVPALGGVELGVVGEDVAVVDGGVIVVRLAGSSWGGSSPILQPPLNTAWPAVDQLSPS
jgi:hypothetical protein